MRKKIVALCFCACLAAGMTACSAETAADSASQAGTESTSAQAADTETTVQAPDSAQSEGQPQQTEPLLVYLNDFDAVIGDLFKEATGYEVGKSTIAFDTGGLLCGLKMVMRVSKLRNLLSPVPCHYIIMGY